MEVFKNVDMDNDRTEQTSNRSENLSELELYVKEPIMCADWKYDVVTHWWGQKSSSLRSMALDVLSTPSSSSSVERLFSRAKMDDGELRQRLGSNRKGELQIMKGWWNFAVSEIINDLDF